MAFPRILQRLFVNSGAGPKLRHDIIPWDEEKSLVALEAWRQAMIGTSMPMTSTTLPAGFMWADGSFAAFAAYPELKAKYDAGGFAGMLLAYNASEADIAAYPGKFKPDAANPTGLFLPRLEGLFARYWTPGAGEAGGYVTDKGRGVYGSAVWGDTTGGLGVWTQTTGAFYATGVLISRPNRDYSVTEQMYSAALQLDAAVLWGEHAGGEFAPVHYTQPIALYLGRSA